MGPNTPVQQGAAETPERWDGIGTAVAYRGTKEVRKGSIFALTLDYTAAKRPKLVEPGLDQSGYSDCGSRQLRLCRPCSLDAV